MAQKTLKQLAEDRGVGHVAPVATDALLGETAGGQPKWFEVDEIPLDLLTGSIATAQIADNQVTDAKLAHGTANSLRGFDGTGAPNTTTAGSGILISGGVISATGGGGGSPSEGSAISIADEGSQILAAAAQINFVGDGVTATDGGGNVAVVTIPGGSNVVQNVDLPIGSPEGGVLTKNQNNTVDVSTLTTHIGTGSGWDSTYTITFVGIPPDGLWLIVANNSGFSQTLANSGSPQTIVSTLDGFVLPTGYAILLIRDENSGELINMGLFPLIAGALAILNTVGTAQIDDDAVTAAKLADTTVVAGSYTNVNATFDAQGRCTFAENGTGGGGSFTGFDIQATTTGTTLSPTGAGKQYQLNNATSCAVTLTTGLTDEGETVIHALVDPSGDYTILADTGLTLNGAAAPGTVTISDFVGAKVLIKRNGTDFQVDGDLKGNRDFKGATLVNATINNVVLTGTVTVPDAALAIADTSGLQAALDAKLALAGGIMTGELDANGQLVTGNRAEVLTSITGSLTSVAHSGRILVTSGNVTVPNAAGDVGFNCTLVAGGAHTVTFGVTTSAAMATGDIMSIFVQSTSVIRAVLVAAADQVAFA